MGLVARIRKLAAETGAKRGSILEKKLFKVYHPILNFDSEFGYPIQGMQHGVPGGWEKSAFKGAMKLTVDKERGKYWKLLGVTTTKVAMASTMLLATYIAVAPTYFLTEPVKIERAITFGRQVLGKIFGF